MQTPQKYHGHLIGLKWVSDIRIGVAVQGMWLLEDIEYKAHQNGMIFICYVQFHTIDE